MFKLARTYDDPSSDQRGFPAPGAGAQTSGNSLGINNSGGAISYEPVRPTKGFRSWLADFFLPSGSQRGFPSPEGPGQRRPRGSMPNSQTPFGGVSYVETPDWDRGASAYAPNFGKVLTNPIGGGIAALYRPQASYGPGGQYINGAIWWSSQDIPTSINLQGLSTADELSAILSTETIYGVVRTTG